MQVNYQCNPSWPCLAWLARVSTNDGQLHVKHGRKIEIREQWFCEAVWDGDFDAGGFDATDIVTGSGGRIHEDSITFVSSGSTLDRLHYVETPQGLYVSNSLCALGVELGVEADPGYGDYFHDFGSIVDGLAKYQRQIEHLTPAVNFLYFDNLLWRNGRVELVSKPHGGRQFSTFEEYHAFLLTSMKSIAKNAEDAARKQRYSFYATLSSGYDSTAVATLGATVGCRNAVTFAHARGGEADDGRVAAEVLGLELEYCDRNAWRRLQRPEPQFIVADAKGEDRYFAVCASTLENRILLTGFHGDKLWDKYTESTGPHIVRGDRSGLSLSEFRLRVGFLNCSPAFWSARNVAEIVAISNHRDMAPWDVAHRYSRPICRRIAEEAGIPRQAFGVRKRAASEQTFTSPDFLTRDSMDDYMQWLRAKKKTASGRGLPWLLSEQLDHVLFNSLAITEKSALWWRQKKSQVPLMWRIGTSKALFRATLATQLATPMYIRRYQFAWAFERALAAYQVD